MLQHKHLILMPPPLAYFFTLPCGGGGIRGYMLFLVLFGGEDEAHKHRNVTGRVIRVVPTCHVSAGIRLTEPEL